MTLTNAQVKAWAQFYARLVAVNIWNAFGTWLYVVSGAVAAQSAGVVDIRSIGWSGALFTFLGTLLVRVAMAIFNHPLPEPTEPA